MNPWDWFLYCLGTITGIGLGVILVVPLGIWLFGKLMSDEPENQA